MSGANHFLRTRRHVVAILIALALAVRVLVPQGWMPSQVEGQVITICTGVDGMTQMVLGKDGKLHEMPKGDHDKSDKGDKPCAFAGMAMAASLPDAANAILLPDLVDAAAASAPSTTIGRGLAAPPPPSTGPPALI